ncbi:hypothetical protein [Cohaesibacter gelatinilyticus]|uniref:Uncharacterized protein n=1 Tax=Cohaesibacter gelatinilyticus TaxID=372072 RepID=A0A285PCG7_9HYPH|nr:hypothetical protein [Cohaesibacter gelatinilyticus]SNZ19434.1 hypothetical protein SAMN06265368_2519 [Cohaesibacter gelatinilyticus]
MPLNLKKTLLIAALSLFTNYSFAAERDCPTHANDWVCVDQEFDGSTYNGPMKFHWSNTTFGAGSAFNWIAAQGKITANTPSEFETFLANLKRSDAPFRKGTEVHLNSMGGNVLAGLQLGAIIRKHDLNTRIGQTKSWNYSFSKTDLQKDIVQSSFKPGVCASSCAYAFLGGVNRSFTPNDKLLVHQFYNREAVLNPDLKTNPAAESAETQLLAGYVAQYVYAMIDDIRVFALASATDSSDASSKLLQIDEKLARKINVIREKTRSNFIIRHANTTSGLVYLDARTDDGIDISITCTSSSLTFHYNGLENSFSEPLKPTRLAASVDGSSEAFDFKGGFPAKLRFPNPSKSPGYATLTIYIKRNQWPYIRKLAFDSWVFGRVYSSTFEALMPALNEREIELSKILRKSCS